MVIIAAGCKTGRRFLPRPPEMARRVNDVMALKRVRARGTRLQRSLSLVLRRGKGHPATRSSSTLFRGRQLDLLLGRLERLLLLAFLQNELVAPRGDPPELAHHGARPGRNQPTDDDVLL